MTPQAKTLQLPNEDNIRATVGIGVCDCVLGSRSTYWRGGKSKSHQWNHIIIHIIIIAHPSEYIQDRKNNTSRLY